MSIFLLYHRKTAPTGRLLRAVLNIPGGKEIRGNPEVVIRWGNQKASARTGFNSSNAMAAASDKLRAFGLFKAAGVRIPEFTTDYYAAREGVWMGRKRHGFGGRDIQVCADGHMNDGASPEFWTKFIPNRRELRIHVFNGEVIRVQGKYLDFPEQNTNPYIKNYAQGYRFRTPRLELRPDRYEQAKKAVEALGLVWGAVDLVIGEDDKAYVLEVNTAPKLAPLTMRQYSEAIRKYVRNTYDITITPDYTVLGGEIDE